jgi:hypothetical protein
MRKHILALTGSVLVLAWSAVTGSAQQQAPGGETAAQQAPSPEMGQDQPMAQPRMAP